MPPEGGTRSSMSTMSGGWSNASSNAPSASATVRTLMPSPAQEPDQRAHDGAARRDDETLHLARRRQLFVCGPLVGEHSIAGARDA